MSSALDPVLREILVSGIAAPSADNCHRFRVSVESARKIRISGPNDAPKLASQSRLLFLVSFGAVLENMRLRALARGLALQVTWLGEPTTRSPSVELAFEATSEAADPLVDAIPVRHTNRSLLFRGPALTPSSKEGIEAATTRVHGCALTWLDDDRRRAVAARLARIAETERFRTRELHEELFSTVRFDLGWTATCDRGLPPGALGVERPLRAPFRWLGQWPVMRALNVLGAHHGLGLRSAGLPIRLAPNVAAVSVDPALPRAAVEGGRAMQRSWLALTLRGMAVQVFAAPAIYADDANRDSRQGLRLALTREWQSVLPPGHTPVMLFRIGRAPEPPVRTGRPEVEAFL